MHWQMLRLLLYLLRLTDVLDIDLLQAAQRKMKLNARNTTS